jgi:hypothetical protein
MLLAVAAVSGSLGSAQAAVPGGSIGTTVVVATARPSLSCTELTSGTVLVRSNVPWVVTAQTPRGVVVIIGEPSTGTRVVLPQGTTAYTIVMRTRGDAGTPDS